MTYLFGRQEVSIYFPFRAFKDALLGGNLISARYCLLGVAIPYVANSLESITDGVDPPYCEVAIYRLGPGKMGSTFAGDTGSSIALYLNG